jgi:hypothetical protein
MEKAGHNSPDRFGSVNRPGDGEGKAGQALSRASARPLSPAVAQPLRNHNPGKLTALSGHR